MAPRASGLPARHRAGAVPVTNVRAILHRSCCDHPLGGPGTVRLAAWELFVAPPGVPAPWPHHRWPSSRRHLMPTLDERAQALADLGYALAPAAEWQWREDMTPTHHGHPSVPTVSAGADVVQVDTEGTALRFPETAVPCPLCAAAGGEPCTSHSGTRVREHDVHRARRAAYKMRGAR
ncbi:DUF6303 family protein [Streptomyces sp. NPDC014861]|uniref:DUF6303 family protein n=1 Tax=Streptomyces sp. NPDC014861 TaxID=3364923 RepID=UPI003700AACB